MQRLSLSIVSTALLLPLAGCPPIAADLDASTADGGGRDGSSADAGPSPDTSAGRPDAGGPDVGPTDPDDWVGTPPGPSLGRGEAPVVLWPRPGHAHPGMPFVFSFVAFDPENEALRFGLEGAPAGMSVDGHGTVRWPAPAAGTYAITLLVDDGRADTLEVPFSLEVDASHFLFVALDGRPGASGTIDDPMDDVEAAIPRLRALGWGTIFVRGGTYSTPWGWETTGHPSPLRGATGTQDHPYALRGYPGESVVFDCGGAGYGPWNYAATYVLFTDFEVRNANGPERGGVGVDAWGLAQNVTVRDSNWDRTENCTGFLIRGEEAICHRCRAIDNYDRDSDHWNSSNYLVYADGEGATGTRYIIDSASSGSVVGIKVKHAGTGRLLVHASRSDDDDNGIAVADDGTEIRYCTIEGSDIALTMGMADPNAFTRGDVWFHHNTVVDSRIGFSIVSGYADRDPVRVTASVFSTSATLGSTEASTLMTFVWPYIDTPPSTLEMTGNCLAAPALDTGFRYGRAISSFDGWQARGLDGTSVTSVPIVFTDGLRVPPSSPCATLRAGAWE